MNKKEFIERVATKSGKTRGDCKIILNTILEEIVNVVKEEGEIKFLGFATFKNVVRPGRKMYSALNGKEVEVKEKNTMRAKFSTNVIEKLNS